MGEFILITGGARSGKSTFAERLAKHYDSDVIYVATAQIFDNEMADRVEKHRKQRPESWKLIEEPYDIENVLHRNDRADAVILLDCVTIWLSNLLLAGLADDQSSDEQEIDDPTTSKAYPELESAILGRVKNVAEIASRSNATMLLVTNEVGLGIVPDNPLGRLYRDLSGKSNQLLAQSADKVYLVVAGYPLDVKKLGQATLDDLNLTRS